MKPPAEARLWVVQDLGPRYRVEKRILGIMFEKERGK